MYQKSVKGWLKHWDFILLDMVCLQVAFVAAYMVRHGISNPYAVEIYRNEAIALVLIQFFITFAGQNFKNVLKRGYYKEFIATLRQVLLVTMASTFYLFMVKEGSHYSRMTLLLTGTFYFLLSYPVRLIWKKQLKSGAVRIIGQRSLLIITDTERAEEAIESLKKHNYSGFQLKGIALTDKKSTEETICNVQIVADRDTVVEYVCREWVDEIIINLPTEKIEKSMLEAFQSMGVTIHVCLVGYGSLESGKHCVERLGGYTVLTSSVRMVSISQLFSKRVLDIIGAIVGCLLTGIFFLFVAPIIYIKSPGPIFFSQVRVGKNGKKFKMYKFRSMYMDAEERKKELIAANQVEDGMMFKIKDDPRIIKGIGHFIRKYSIDEFPQFFNVLKGDMSLVGTRPPTLDEWEKYDLRHRMRLSIKPGITGLWQISGRSGITNFEEVVKLDAKYIADWSMGQDIKILLKTIGCVMRSSGAM